MALLSKLIFSSQLINYLVMSYLSASDTDAGGLSFNVSATDDCSGNEMLNVDCPAAICIFNQVILCSCVSQIKPQQSLIVDKKFIAITFDSEFLTVNA